MPNQLGEVAVPHLQSKDRRRRLRLIKAVEDKWAERFQSAASALAVASDTEADRIDSETLRRLMFEQCGAKPSTCVRIELPGIEPITVMMNRPWLVVGSDASCDLRLEHDEVKPRHSYLQWIEGRIFCCEIAPRQSLFPDRNSQSNGRWVNHQPIAIGPYQLTLDESVADDIPDYSPLDRSQQLAVDFPQLGLQFAGVEQSDNQWPVNRPLTMVGRGSQCKLRLNHTAMAHVQACLLRTSNGFWLIDVAGTRTTGVNGRAIRIAPLDIGDSMQLGPFQIEVVTMAFRPIEVAAIQKATWQKPLPPIRFDREPKTLASKNSADAKDGMEPGTVVLPVLSPLESHHSERSSIDSADPLTEPADIESTPVESMAAVQRPTIGKMHPPSILSIPLELKPPAMPESTAVTNNDQQETPAMLADTANPVEKGACNFAIADFIQQQQSQLELLKSRLDKLKAIYETAAGQLISKKMRDTLEKPVVETMKSYDSMQEMLAQLIESVENRGF